VWQTSSAPGWHGNLKSEYQAYNVEKNNFRKTALVVFIMGVVYPFIFSLLTSVFVPGRDELPALDNPMGAIGFCGLYLFSLPIIATAAGLILLINTVHGYGYIIPLFDSFTSHTQMGILMTIGYLCNLLFWLLIVTFIKRIKKKRASLEKMG